MSGRGLSAAQRAAAVGANVVVVPLFEMLFNDDASPLRMTLGPWSVTVDGNTYSRLAGLATIEPFEEASDGTEGLSFSVTGLDAGIIDIVAAQNYRGTIVRLLEQWLTSPSAAATDADVYTPLGSPTVEWVGRLITLGTEEQGGRASVAGQAEHYEAELRRPRTRHYNQRDQQRRYPTDRGFDMVDALADAKTLVWPNKEALRRP